MKGLSEKRLSDYMAEQIADEILAGRIEGGSQLKQEELAEVFGASRIPIREAFQVLESQGLIVRLATKRIYTVELDEEQIELIFEMIGEIQKSGSACPEYEKSNRGKGSIFDGNKTGPVASCTDGEWISDESAEKCFGVLYPVCHKM